MKSIRTLITGVISMGLLSASVVIAGENMGSTSSPHVTGEWNFTSKFEAMTADATMTLTKNADGNYAGTWSSQWGENTLSDITADANKIKFVETSNFGGQDMKTSYEGTLDSGKFKGTSKNQFGNAIFEGTGSGNAKDPFVGEWQINITIPAREVVDKMTITQNPDGNLAGKWEGTRGAVTISDLKFSDGKLTFIHTSKMGEMEFSTTYEGTVTGDTIKGKFTSEFGEREANASRAIAKAETPKAEPNKPAGKK